MNMVKRIFRIISFLWAAFFFYSCQTSPVSQKIDLFHEKSETPGTYSPNWEYLTTGIEYTEGIIKSPQMEFWGLKIDLHNPGVEIVVNSPGSRMGIIPSIKTSSFAETYLCAAAINTNPFNTSSTKEGVPLTIVGITISGGVMISRPDTNYAALVFYKDGKPEILWQKDLGSLDNIENAVGGFFVILKDGQFQDDISDFRRMARHPRSAAGLSSDGRYLYLLVIDGRRPSSGGATEEETASILVKLGARDGLIFDGGGSTCLALKYPDGKVRSVNTPIHNGIPGQQRAVATCLGIRIHGVSQGNEETGE